MTIQNEVLSAIAARRSCRAYLPEQIKPEELQAVLEAGTWAPTGMNRQSPIIVVVQDKETRDKLSAMNAAVMGNNGDPFYGAPTVLVVLADRNMSTHVEDGSLVLGNLLLAASSIGLGSCWINRAKEVFDTEEGKALLRNGAWMPTVTGALATAFWGIPRRVASNRPRPVNRIMWCTYDSRRRD